MMLLGTGSSWAGESLAPCCFVFCLENTYAEMAVLSYVELQ